MNVLALCAGVGGLELGLQLATNGTARAVCFVEREVYPAACLVARMEEGVLCPAPVWSDLGTFDGRPWRGVVDCVTAGFPCQPFSVAGKREGTEDERWLWPDIARVIRDVGPRLVFLENVRGLLTHSGGFGRVLGDLADSGYDAEWGVFSAAEVGARHIRQRMFLVAYAHGARLEGLHAPKRGEYLQSAPRTIRREWRASPGVYRATNGTPRPMDRLRACGNGVVPLVAAHAFCTLAARVGLTHGEARMRAALREGRCGSS